MRRLISKLRRGRRDEDGAITVDFVITFPIFFMFLFASFELSFVMMRQVLLDRGVEMAVREVRLNSFNPPEYDELKRMICEGAGLIPNCDNALKLEMYREDPRGTLFLKPEPDCIDRSLPVQPASIYETGGPNEIMIVTACVKYMPFFPTARLGETIVDEFGEYGLVATNMYVTEP